MADAHGLPRALTYRHRYRGGAPCQLWVGRGSYVVTEPLCRIDASCIT